MTLYDRQAELEKTLIYVEGEIEAVKAFLTEHPTGPFTKIWETELRLDQDIQHRLENELQEVKQLIMEQERYENDAPDIC